MAWTRTTERLLVVLCAALLLATSLAASSSPVAASDINARIAGIRSSQAALQRSMRALDSTVARLKAQRVSANKAAKQAERARNQARSTLASAKAVLLERRQRLARVEAEFPNPNDAPNPERHRQRLQGIRAEIRVAERRKANIVSQVGSLTRIMRARKSSLHNLKAQRVAASSRLRGAEGSLSALIKQMHDLARVKAEEQATVSLAAAGQAVFSWPSAGRITQSYGCTGFRLNPRKGSCRHFHDGIDVVSGYGTPVRAVAVGVVAYSGWNPYDKEGRAYVVDIVHPDGFTSRYGHLIPTNHVRAGDLVHTGQVIGKMGSTGKSTGTHLHFELLRNGRDVDPTQYLPKGVVVVDKTTTRAGLAAKNKAERKKQRRVKQRKDKAEPKPAEQQVNRPSVTRSFPTAEWEDPSAFQLCPDKGAEDCDPTDLLARLGSAADGSPGIPRPYREQQPSPA
jgi:murein DD-endopeptidase MepM/ murein hydrolase activator NlpD